MTENTSDVRFRSRVWSVLRALVFVCVIIFIWNGMAKTACAFVAIALVMGWVNLYQLRSQEIEKPYYRLWLNVIDGFLSFAVMTSIFVRDLMQNEHAEKLLGVLTECGAVPVETEDAEAGTYTFALRFKKRGLVFSVR